MLNSNIGSMTKCSSYIQKDATVNTVLKTNDYSKFQTKEGNRSLNELHLKRLMSSVQENDLLEANPILVNENFEIIDGQHRFKVCEQLNKPIHYIVVNGLGLLQIQTLNANTKNWKMEDYVDGYCSMGMPEYCYLKTQIEKTNYGITILLAIFADLNGQMGHCLKNGNLKLANKNRGLVILKWIQDWEQFYYGSDRRSFVLALVSLYNVKEYSHEKMMQKLKYQSMKLVDCTNTKTYIALLEEIYNYKERGEKLRFF
jgi:hypothetical protein